MNIILHGATGAMGHAVDRYVKANGKHQIIAYVSPDYEETAPPCYKTLFEYEGPADCIVDFSSHFAAGAITEYAAKRGIPLVIATTGHTEDEAALIKACSAKVPVFQSANMSLGVAVLAKLANGIADDMLTTTFKDAHPEVAWRDISGMRNFLVHEYFRVDSDTVWAVIHSEIVELKEHITHYLAETDWEKWGK